MATADEFRSLFDDRGGYKNGDGEVEVTLLTTSGGRYPGKLRFKNGLLVSAAMNGASSWGYPDETPLDGLKFLLHFDGAKPQAVFVDQGRLVASFEVRNFSSKQKFMENFRLARNLFLHTRDETDNSNIDANSVSDALIRGSLWLTPKVVEGFNVSDFSELTTDQQSELASAVQAFKTVASHVPDDE
jgi:hypothetical protein